MDTNLIETRQVNHRTLQRLQKEYLSLNLNNMMWNYESSWDKVNTLEFRGKLEKPGMMMVLNLYIIVEYRSFYYLFLNQIYFYWFKSFEGLLFVFVFFLALPIQNILSDTVFQFILKYCDGKPRWQIFRNVNKLLIV